MKIALDFDGTIVDSMPLLEKLAVALLGEEFGLDPAYAGELYRKTAGAPFAQQLTEMLPGDDTSELAEVYANRKELITLGCAPFGDVVPALESWLEDGHEVVLVSSSTQRLLLEWLAVHAMTDYFEYILGYRPGFDKVAQLQSLTPDVFIADASRDAGYAAVAGTRFVGLCRDPALLSVPLRAAEKLTELTW